MKIPVSLLGTSRRLGTDEEEAGRYIPSLDCTLMIKAEEPLVSAAESAHRWIALQTSVGKTTFLWDLVLNFVFAQIMNEQAPFGNELLARRRLLLSSMFNESIAMLQSYEILDEVYSALLTRGYLLYRKQHQEIERLESYMRRCYLAQIFATYERAKEIMIWTDSNPGSIGRWQWVFTDAANIPPDWGSNFASDRRLEFFLTAAERAMNMGVPPTKLISFLYETGQRYDYDIRRRHIRHPEVLPHDLLKISDDESKRRGQPPIVTKGDPNMSRISKDCLAVYASRLRDAEIWDQSLGMADPPRGIYESRGPAIIGYTAGDDWRFWLNPKNDDRTIQALLHHTQLTILRNAVLYREDECPLALISTGSTSLCYPITDVRCIYRRLRFLSDGEPLQRDEATPNSTAWERTWKFYTLNVETSYMEKCLLGL
jgi:hypothetical protein